METEVVVRSGVIKFNFGDSVMVLVHEGLQAELLHMFYQYPNDELTLTTIADNLENTAMPDIEEALESLVKTNLVEKRNQEDLTLYSLTTNP